MLLNLVNLVIDFTGFFVEPLGFSMYRNMSHLNKKFFTSFFPNWMSLVSFSYLSALAKTSNTVLNGSGKTGHVCLVPDLREKAIGVSTLRMILVGLPLWSALPLQDPWVPSLVPEGGYLDEDALLLFGRGHPDPGTQISLCKI